MPRQKASKSLAFQCFRLLKAILSSRHPTHPTPHNAGGRASPWSVCISFASNKQVLSNTIQFGRPPNSRQRRPKATWMQSPESCCFENCEAPKTATDLDDRAPVAAKLSQRYCRFCIPQFLWTRLELSFRGCKIPWKNGVNRVVIASSSCKTVARPLQLILHEKISLRTRTFEAKVQSCAESSKYLSWRNSSFEKFQTIVPAKWSQPNHRSIMSRESQGGHGEQYQTTTGWWLTYPSEKYESPVGIWLSMIIPKIWKNKTCSKPPTGLCTVQSSRPNEQRSMVGSQPLQKCSATAWSNSSWYTPHLRQPGQSKMLPQRLRECQWLCQWLSMMINDYGCSNILVCNISSIIIDKCYHHATFTRQDRW